MFKLLLLASLAQAGQMSPLNNPSSGAPTTPSSVSASGCLKTGTSGNPLSVNCDTSKNVQISSTIVASYLENSGAADGTAYYSFVSSMAASLPSGAEISNILGRIRWYKGDNSNAILNGVEGVCSSDVADESITCRGASLRTYTVPGGTLRTSIGADISARASYSGGTEITAESGTGFTGARIWMAPYFSDATIANVNNFHGLWIYNEASAKTVTNGIKLGSAGGGFTNDLNLQNGEVITNSVDGWIKQSGDSWVTGQAVFDGSATVKGNAFSVGGSTLVVTSGNIGIGTASPGALFAVKSTFTVADSGIISAPSQPAVRAFQSASGQNIPNAGAVLTPIFFGSETYDTQNMHDVAVSSEIFTIPAGGGGLYQIHCMAVFAADADGLRYMYIQNGAGNVTYLEKDSGSLGAGAVSYADATVSLVLAAGDAVRCAVYQDAGGALALQGAAGGSYTMAEVIKLW